MAKVAAQYVDQRRFKKVAQHYTRLPIHGRPEEGRQEAICASQMFMDVFESRPFLVWDATACD
jgi:hypothetical protein